MVGEAPKLNQRLLPALKLILERDIPRLDIEAENPFFTEKRSAMSLKELLALFEKEYSQIADLVAGLSEDQLSRKIHIPLFKDTPMTEYPTLTMFIEALGGYHLDFHINHI